MRNNNATILRAIANGLRHSVLPAVTAEAAVSSGQLCLGLIQLLLSREEAMPRLMTEQIKTTESLRGRIGDVLRGRDVVATCPVTPPHPPALSLDFVGDLYDDLHTRLLRAQADLAIAAAHLPNLRDHDADTQGVVDEVLEELAHNELALTTAFLESLQPAVPQAGESHHADGHPARLFQRIERYLIDRCPDTPGLRVTDIASSGFSMSKHILFVSTTDDSGASDEIVIRQEKSVRFMEPDCTLVRNEYSLMRSAYELGLPVPEPLWLETLPVLGTDFMVMRKASGAQLGEPLKAFQPLGEDLIMQIAELLAQLHREGLAPFEGFFRDSGQAAVLDMNVKEATLYRIEQWKRYFSAPTQFPSPSNVWLFDWLERNVPENSAKPVLVHGDFNIHNLLGENGQITALLDWEWGHAGNALEDLNNVRHHVEKYSNWERFCRHYEAHGGTKLEATARTLDYYRCLTNTLFSAASARLAWHVANGDLRDLAAVFGGDDYGFEFQRIALEASLGAHRI